MLSRKSHRLFLLISGDDNQKFEQFLWSFSLFGREMALAKL
jgi:hypothetical protein